MKAQSATSPVDGPRAAGATMPHDLYDAVPSNAVASAPAAPQKVGATDGAVRRHALGNRSQSESDLSKEYARLQAQRLAAARAALTATDEVQSFRRNDLAARTTVQQGEQVPITHPNFVVPPLSVGQGGVTDANGQAQKNGFIAATAKAGDSTYLAATRTPPVSGREVKAGTVIPAVMVGGINSDLPGQIVGQVSRNVYDSASGNSLLIPAGAKVIGTYDSSVTHGQKRVLVAWTRIIFPDGSSISLRGMPGAD
ncbi:MAG: TrbI/VirB10 family protein, partial [Paracoccaceae bacterium]|nr:TrbI/VirB10 family protein [Paracoccaceae bacterium]